MNRREALKVLGTGVAFAGLGLGRVAAGETPKSSSLGWELTKLTYGYAALEPHIDARTMEIHHAKHHQAYITNALNLLKDHPDLRARGPEALVRNLASVPEEIRTGIRNNAGGHINHAFFWKLLTPAPTPAMAPESRLARALAEGFGADLGVFKKQFADAAMKRFGSGWAWLSTQPDGKLVVHSTSNQDSPSSEGLTPIIGLDVWEHAYYLHYQNRRADYVAAFWNILDWKQAELNYAAAVKG